MTRCIPCEEADTKNAKVQAAYNMAKKFQMQYQVERLLLVEVLRDGDGFKAGDYTFCLPDDQRLQTIFHEINMLLL